MIELAFKFEIYFDYNALQSIVLAFKNINKFIKIIIKKILNKIFYKYNKIIFYIFNKNIKCLLSIDFKFFIYFKFYY